MCRIILYIYIYTIYIYNKMYNFVEGVYGSHDNQISYITIFHYFFVFFTTLLFLYFTNVLYK